MSETEPLRGLVESVYSTLTDPLFAKLKNAVYSDDKELTKCAIAEYCNQLMTLDMMYKVRRADIENVRISNEKLDEEIKDLYTDLETGSEQLESLKRRLLNENSLIQHLHESFEVKERYPLSENSTIDLDLSIPLSEYDKQIELLHKEEVEVDKLITEHLSALDELIPSAARMCEAANEFRELHDAKAADISENTSQLLGSSSSSRQSSKSPFPESRIETEGEELVEREVEEAMEVEQELDEERAASFDKEPEA